MTVNLRIWDSNDVQRYIELYDDDPINLTKQFQDIVSVNAPNGSFSQTFRIPATGVNKQVFQNFDNVNSVGTFNPKRKLRAELEANTLPISRGYVQFLASYTEKEVFPEYEIVFFGETVNLFKSVGDAKLAELDLSAYEHDLTYSNILSSWAGTLFSGDIRYGILDKGRNWAQDGTGRPINASLPIFAGDFTPYIRVPRLVERIIEGVGFTVESTFLNSSYMDNVYTPLFNGSLFVISEEEINGVGFNVGLTTDQTISTVGFNAFTNLSDTGNFYDNGGNYTIGADDYWTVPYSGIFLFRAWVSGTNNGSDTDTIRIRVTKNGNTVALLTDIEIEAGDTFQFANNFGFELEEGDELRIGVQSYADNLGDTPNITLNSTATPDEINGTGWVLLEASTPYEGVNVIPSANAPDIKQKDFLDGLQKAFNLVFVPDEVNPLMVKIEPLEDFKGTGDTLDWTNIIDYSKTVKVEPTTAIQSREYKWTYKEEKDYLNQFYVDNFDRVYGEFEIEDTENDFSTGTKDIKNPFGAYPCAYIAGSNLVIHKSIVESGQTLKEPLCKIVYWGGLVDCSTIYVRNEVSGLNVARTNYPYFGHYSSPNATIDGEDLNYGSETPLHVIEGNPTNNLYNKYWRSYVNELYSVESRKMTAFFKIDVADYYNVGFDDLIWIKDSYWRLLKINQFQVNVEGVTQCELIKVLDTPRPCEFIPSQIAIGGVVQFTDEAGATSTGSQECCEFWGYTWNITNARCYAQQGGGIIERLALSPQANNGTVPNLDFGRNSVGVGSMQGLTIGVGNTVGEENFYSSMIGRNNIASNQLGTYQHFGEDGSVWAKGSHFSAPKISVSGDNQSGVIHATYTGVMSGTVTLFPYLDIPNNSTLAISLNYVISEWNTATARIITEHYLSASSAIIKDGSGTSFVTPVTIKDVGTSGGGVYSADIDNTTDPTQHRIQLSKSGAALANNVNVVCKIEYVITRHS